MGCFAFLRRLLRPLLGWAFGLTVLLTAIFGNYIITLFLPLVLLDKHVHWRRLMDRAISFWMMIPMTFLEFIFGVRYRVTGDFVDFEKPALIIMNHRTRLDWMYLWSALFKMNPWLLTSSKISLKEQLKSLPGAGFGMAASQFIFLQRNVEEDKQRLTEAVEYYTGVGGTYQILLFPEGTDKSPWTTKKSDAFAKKNGFRALKHVIYPRTAGFLHLLEKMRKEEYISYVYDVTVAYPTNVVQSEVDLVLRGRTPDDVHFDFRRIDIADVPKSEAELNKWLNEIWVAKDERLDRYYSQPKGKRKFVPSGEGHVWERMDPKQTFAKIFAFCFWVFVVTVWSYHMFFLRFVQIGFTYFFLTSAFLNWRYGGIDRMVYGRFASWRERLSSRIV
uniref:PlsC domain-containing protein n=1 Tax=Steinernema glaseri TaxID=37863 RepID=A0A1I8AGD9_9BILA